LWRHVQQDLQPESAVSSFARKPVEYSREIGKSTLSSTELAAEKHYSVSELARLWGLSERTIRRMFENEPGVLCWGSSESRFRRGYKTLRVPETVMLRVHRQLRIAG
jgi:transcriptional regulator GlxA family with amidase domain